MEVPDHETGCGHKSCPSVDLVRSSEGGMVLSHDLSIKHIANGSPMGSVAERSIGADLAITHLVVS